METNAKTFDGKFENYTDDGEKFGIDWFDDYRAYFIGFYTVCSSSAVFGNILLLTVILKYTKLRTRVYLFIGNICVSDMFLGLVVMPYKAVSISVEEIGRRKYTCILRLVLISTFVGASILNLFCMSFERYFAVAHPLKHTKYYTNCRAVVLVMISWTVALVIGLLPLVGVNTWTDDATCFVPKVLPKSFMFLVAVIYFIFLMTSVVMYIIVARKALNHVKSKDVKNREIQYYRHVPFDLNRIKVMVIINGIFIVCLATKYNNNIHHPSWRIQKSYSNNSTTLWTDVFFAECWY